MSARAKVCIVASIAVFAVVSLWSAGIGESVGSEPLPRADKVVIFGIPRLGFNDVTTANMPNLTALAEHGAIGALQVKTGGVSPNVAEAYATIGAGSLVASGSNGSTAYDATTPRLGTTALASQRIVTGDPNLAGAVMVPAVPSLTASGFPAVGALGTQLAAHHRLAGVVSNANQIDATGQVTFTSPAALAVVDHDGVVPVGSVSGDLLRNDRVAPFGRTVDSHRFIAAVDKTLDHADVVVVDPGETSRAVGYLPEQTKSHAAVTRTSALKVTDRLLGRLVASVGPRTMVIVVGMTPSSGLWSLTPVVVVGAGVVPGDLGSPSTHRKGLVTITDLGPTVLQVLGLPNAPLMNGNALRESPGDASWTRLKRLDAVSTAATQTLPPLRTLFVVVQVLTYLFALGWKFKGFDDGRVTRILTTLVLAIASWPLMTLLLRLSSWISARGVLVGVVSWVGAFAIAELSRRLCRSGLDALLLLCLSTSLVIIVDLATGTHLLFGTIFGYAPGVTMRYFGINNAAFALLGTCVIIFGALAFERAGESAFLPASRTWIIWIVSALAVVTMLADGAPWLGADVGGILTLVPVLGVMVFAFSGRTIRWRHLAVAVGAALLVLLGFVGVESLRNPDRRSHIGRFFLGTPSGSQPVVPTFDEKWAGSMALFTHSIWTWFIPAIVAYCVYVLVVAKGWTRALPEGSPARIATVTAFVFGVVGWLLNDSGILVTALVFVYLGPLMVLREFGEIGNPHGGDVLLSISGEARS